VGTDWGVHIQAAGHGASALKYLGAYVARTAISNARIPHVTTESVSFRWKNRAAGGSQQTSTVSLLAVFQNPSGSGTASPCAGISASVAASAWPSRLTRPVISSRPWNA